jgi:hypothetical protein
MADDASARAVHRRTTWTSKVYRGPDVHGEMERDDLDEWAAMDPIDRLALTWALSLEQFGGADDGSLLSRLPRSAYRVERR